MNTEREHRDSAKMLVILQNGEQRLITFTLPKESCTVQELLEQVGVSFSADTNIQCVPNPGVSIDYLVTVGVNFTEAPSEIINAAEKSLQMKQHQDVYQPPAQQPQAQLTPPQQPQPPHQAIQTQPQIAQNQQHALHQPQNQQRNSMTVGLPIQTTAPVPPQKPSDPPPKYIAGMCAVCPTCGYSSINHAQCQR